MTAKVASPASGDGGDRQVIASWKNLPTTNSPTPSVPQNRREYVLAELRCASLRAKLHATEIDTIGVALRDGMIDPEAAIMLVHGAGALSYVQQVPTTVEAGS